MKRASFFVVSAAILLITSCDKIENPIQDGGIGPIDTTTVLRKVLLEDFTGHRCNNCPAATEVAETLHDLYEDQLIIAGVHAPDGFFVNAANPPNSDGSYSTYFGTEAGNTYAQNFGVTSLPKGMVSRREFNGSVTMSEGSWGSAIAEIINQEAILKISFNNVSYDQGNNSISVEIEVEAREDLDDDYRCIVFLLEDGIIDWQVNSQASPPDVPDYEHNHVLRDVLGGTWGSNVFTGQVSAGTTQTISFNNFSVDPDWVMANSTLVAFVYDVTTEEVWQAEKTDIIP